MKSELNRQKRVVVSLRKKGYTVEELQDKTESDIMNLNLPKKLKQDIWAMIETKTMWRYLDDKPAESDITLKNIMMESGIVSETIKQPITSEEELQKMNESIKGASEVSLSVSDLRNLVNSYSYTNRPAYMKVLTPILEGMHYDGERLKQLIRERIKDVKEMSKKK